jgi:hypothetical protein
MISTARTIFEKSPSLIHRHFCGQSGAKEPKHGFVCAVG